MDLEKRRAQQQQLQDKKRLDDAAAESAALRPIPLASDSLRDELAGKRTAQGDVLTRLATVDVEKKTKRRKETLIKAQNTHTLAQTQSVFISGLRTEAIPAKTSPQPPRACPSANKQKTPASCTSTRGQAGEETSGGGAASVSPEQDEVIKRLFEQGTSKVKERQLEYEKRAEEELRKSTQFKVFVSAGTKEILEGSGLRHGTTLEQRTQNMMERKRKALEEKWLHEQSEIRLLQEQGRRARRGDRVRSSSADVHDADQHVPDAVPLLSHRSSVLEGESRGVDHILKTHHESGGSAGRGRKRGGNVKAAWSAAAKGSVSKSSPCPASPTGATHSRPRSAPHNNTTAGIPFSPAVHSLSVSRQSIELSMSPRETLWPGMPSPNKSALGGEGGLAADERAVLESRLNTMQTQLNKQQELQRQERQQQQEEQQRLLERVHDTERLLAAATHDVNACQAQLLHDNTQTHQLREELEKTTVSLKEAKKRELVLQQHLDSVNKELVTCQFDLQTALQSKYPPPPDSD